MTRSDILCANSGSLPSHAKKSSLQVKRTSRALSACCHTSCPQWWRRRSTTQRWSTLITRTGRERKQTQTQPTPETSSTSQSCNSKTPSQHIYQNMSAIGCIRLQSGRTSANCLHKVAEKTFKENFATRHSHWWTLRRQLMWNSTHKPIKTTRLKNSKTYEQHQINKNKQ